MPINFRPLIDSILRAVRIELADEFDRNFERQGFFGERWKRKLNPESHVLLRSGALRRSILSRQEGDEIVFSSDLPYAAIHNEGGKIKVTAKMKRYFWAKYKECQGGLQRKKDGSTRQNKKNAQLMGAGEFWKRLALMKVGKEITIPKRQFVGWNEAVWRMVEPVIKDQEAKRGARPPGYTAKRQLLERAHLVNTGATLTDSLDFNGNSL